MPAPELHADRLAAEALIAGADDGLLSGLLPALCHRHPRDACRRADGLMQKRKAAHA